MVITFLMGLFFGVLAIVMTDKNDANDNITRLGLIVLSTLIGLALGIVLSIYVGGGS